MTISMSGGDQCVNDNAATVTEDMEKDKGYAWVILVAVFIQESLVFGTTWSVGVFYEIFLVLGNNSAAISLISALNTANCYLGGTVQQNLKSYYRNYYAHVYLLNYK